MADNVAMFIIGIIAGVICACVLITTTESGYGDGYKDGQIDVLTNQYIKYQLTTNQYNETSWTEIYEDDYKK